MSSRAYIYIHHRGVRMSFIRSSLIRNYIPHGKIETIRERCQLRCTNRLAEIKAMADRLRSVREKLYDLLANKLKTPGSWFHLKRSTGMFWYVLACSLLIS
jgi:hypothetical protein